MASLNDIIASFASKNISKYEKSTQISISSEEMKLLALKFIPLCKGLRKSREKFASCMKKYNDSICIFKSEINSLTKWAAQFKRGREINGSTSELSPEPAIMWVDDGILKIGMDGWEDDKFVKFTDLWRSNEFATSLKGYIDFTYEGNYFVLRKKDYYKEEITYSIVIIHKKHNNI